MDSNKIFKLIECVEQTSISELGVVTTVHMDIIAKLFIAAAIFKLSEKGEVPLATTDPTSRATL